jgi:2-C-methyl-D-erythritol 4-phosphate cytidylyltransferase
LKLNNGLIKIHNTFEAVDRNDYVELCTPICINFNLCMFIYKNYIEKNNRITHEFIPILDIMKINYEFIYGNINYLKKITTFEDLKF